MDRDWLEAQLAAGRSIESIAREVGKHLSTVGYRCPACTADRVARHRRRVKELIVRRRADAA
jgi:hypothetical protein